jgi:EAL domain-containing protein (putative c-di-GMP-specific phosphodiesterase class I)
MAAATLEPGRDWRRLSLPAMSHDHSGRAFVDVPKGGIDMSHLRAEFDRVLDDRRITTLFQPVVELATSRVVGFEALARGPHGSPFHTPTKLFAYAYKAGRASELDWVCRAAALQTTMDAGLPSDFTLFVNAEPASLRTECPPDLLETIVRGINRLNIMVELTERYLTEDPAAVLDAVAAARAQGLGIAIDDVGAEPASLAMMPLVHPDVIKLDLSLIQGRPDVVIARTINGVLAEVERTGATILAEGIESERHAAMASAVGATLGQGWRYGRPRPLTDHWPRKRAPTVPLLPPETTAQATPFEIVTKERPTRVATKRLLMSLSRHLEFRAADPAEPAVLVSCFQDARHFDATVRRRYARVATAAVMVAALGRQMPAEPAPRVRGTSLDAADPLAAEWVVIVVGVHFAAALVARHVEVASHVEAAPGRASEPDEWRYEFSVTYDRRLVIAAAQSLVQRLDSTIASRTGAGAE